MVHYIPILRSEAQRRSIKFIRNDLGRTLKDKPVIPLYESFLSEVFYDDMNSLNFFNQILIDYPHYLDEDRARAVHISPNRSVVDIAEKALNLGYKDKVIPVISQETFLPFPYAGLTIEFRDKKKKLRDLGYNKIAFRIFFGPETNSQIQMIAEFINLMGTDDIILIDNIGYDANIECILANIQDFIKFIRGEGIKNDVYVLNLMNVRPLHDNGRNTHNFGPLITIYFGLKGFGDTLIEAKISPDGVRNTTSTRQRGYVKIYDYNRQELVEVMYNRNSDTPASAVANDARGGSIISNHSSVCHFCSNLRNGQLSDLSQLKIYRNGHYILSLIKNVIPAIESAASPSDFDEEGADLISNIINGRTPSGC